MNTASSSQETINNRRRSFTLCGDVYIIDESFDNKRNAYIRCKIDEKEHTLELFPDAQTTCSFGYINLRKCDVYCSMDTKRIYIKKTLNKNEKDLFSKGLVIEVQNAEQVTKLEECLTKNVPVV